LPLNDPRVEKSRQEFLALAEFANQRGYWTGDQPRIAIVGGWAVYAFNPYSGSIDIDLVGSRRVCDSIKNFMTTKRKFKPRIKRYPGFEGIELETPDGPVYVDVGRFGDP
jgi:hypothetical protein